MGLFYKIPKGLNYDAIALLHVKFHCRHCDFYTNCGKFSLEFTDNSFLQGFPFILKEHEPCATNF